MKERKKKRLIGQRLPLSLSLTLISQTPCLAPLAGRATEQGQQRLRQWKEKNKKGSEWAKWPVGFRQPIGIDFSGSGCSHPADGLKKGPAASRGEGHGSSAEILLCLPPVMGNRGQMQVLYSALSATCLQFVGSAESREAMENPMPRY